MRPLAHRPSHTPTPPSPTPLLFLLTLHRAGGVREAGLGEEAPRRRGRDDTHLGKAAQQRRQGGGLDARHRTREAQQDARAADGAGGVGVGQRGGGAGGRGGPGAGRSARVHARGVTAPAPRLLGGHLMRKR